MIFIYNKVIDSMKVINVFEFIFIVVSETCFLIDFEKGKLETFQYIF